MKILFVWTGVTSYMADSWRALAAQPGVELKVIVEQVASGREFVAAKVLAGLDYTLVAPSSADQPQALNLQSAFQPDIIFAVGWHSKVVRTCVAVYPDVKKICCFDMPWRWLPRCVAARFVLRSWVKKFAAAYVPGAEAAKYAKWLGFCRVERGLFAIDQSKFAAADLSKKVRHVLTKSGFFYAGRFSPEKRVDLIEKAFRRYQELGGTWSFDCYGGKNFLQPEEMARVFREKACLLLASSFDPWPLVMLEAKAAGCEVIASDRCGNADELGAIKVPYGDVEAMARAMLAVERGKRSCFNYDRLSEYDVAAWAVRTMKIAEEA